MVTVRLLVPRAQPGEDSAGLHPHLELLLRIGRRAAPRLAVLEVERRAVPGADQAGRAPHLLHRALVERAGQVRTGADEDVDPHSPADDGQRYGSAAPGARP